MKRILVTRMGAIGDLLLTTPVIRALRRRYPDAHITYLVCRGLGVVMEGHPDLDEVKEYDRQRGRRLGEFAAFCAGLRREPYDLHVNLQPSVRTHLMGLFSGAGRRLTYRRQRLWPGSRAAERHAVDDFLRVLRPLGIDPAACERHLDFQVDEAARQQVRRHLEDAGVGTDERLVLVYPGASAAARRWPTVTLAASLRRLLAHQPHWRLVLAGGQGVDQALAARALDRLAPQERQRVLDWAGHLDFRQTAALMERAYAVVTMDSGPMHLAAALGRPLVALFGPSSPNRVGPAPARPDLRTASPVVLTARAQPACAPCRTKTCRRGDQACLARIEPAAVEAALNRVMTGDIGHDPRLALDDAGVPQGRPAWA